MDDNSKRGRRGRTALLLLALCGVSIAGCGGYGIVSPKAYQFATAIYSVANLQSAQRLASIGPQVKAAHDAHELTNQEYAWLQEILDQARKGNWEAAQTAARRMMEDQVASQ